MEVSDAFNCALSAVFFCCTGVWAIVSPLFLYRLQLAGRQIVTEKAHKTSSRKKSISGGGWSQAPMVARGSGKWRQSQDINNYCSSFRQSRWAPSIAVCPWRKQWSEGINMLTTCLIFLTGISRNYRPITRKSMTPSVVATRNCEEKGTTTSSWRGVDERRQTLAADGRRWERASNRSCTRSKLARKVLR